MSITSQHDLPQIPPPWLASYMMGNYSEEYATFNVSPIKVIQSLQISERENETRGEMGGGGGGRKSNKEEKRWKDISSGGGGGGDLQCWIRSDLTKAWGAWKLFSLSFFFFALKGKSTAKQEPHINGDWQTFNSNLSDFHGFYWRCVSPFMPK